MVFDTVIQGRTLQDGSLIETFICIKGDRIADMKRIAPTNGEYGEIHRSGRNIIIPGAIDLHTHMREPGMIHKEDFSSGTISAAFGGVTAIIDMPNSKPLTSDRRTFIEKKELALAKAHVDIGLNMVLHDETVMEDDPYHLKDTALAGFKVFMGETTGAMVMKDLGCLTHWSRSLAHLELPFFIHAEDGDMMSPLRVGREGLLRSHLRSRPADAEASAIEKALNAMGDRSDLLHILHVSSGIGLKKTRGSRATLEVTPHHLLLDIKNFETFNEREGFGKVNPPIRTPSDRAALWGGVRSGKVTTIGSDHAPHTILEKEGETPPSGMPGVETMVPLLLMKVKERSLDLERMTDLVSSGPATRLGLEHRGSLKPGSMADIVIFDINDERKIRGEDLHYRCGWTAFEGMKGIFPVKVFARGDLVIEDETLCSIDGRGRPIKA